jgi:hypothetical protein
MGVRPGVADLQFIWNDDLGQVPADAHPRGAEIEAAGGHHGPHILFLELKRPGGRQSPVQHEFEIECGKAGAMYRIAYDLDEALEVLKGYGILK